MNELETIKEIMKTQLAVEKELRETIISEVPEIAGKLVSELFELIKKEAKSLRIALKPCIVLNYEDSKAYIRIVPLEVGPRLKFDFERRDLFLSHELFELFDIKNSELYDIEFREILCQTLSMGLKDVFASENYGCSCTITKGKDPEGYSLGDVEFIITPKLI